MLETRTKAAFVAWTTAAGIVLMLALLVAVSGMTQWNASANGTTGGTGGTGGTGPVATETPTPTSTSGPSIPPPPPTETPTPTPTPSGAGAGAGGGVVGSGIDPVLYCKWELPDAESVLGGNGMQYGQDDEPFIDPGFPCDRNQGIAETAEMADGVENVIQVLPNAEDQPEARTIENWALVGHPNGIDDIDDVFWKVFHPDGSFKVQIHGKKVEVGFDLLDNDPTILDITDLGAPGQAGAMWDAAHITGQVSDDAITAVDWGIIDLMYQWQRQLWYGDWDIHKEQMCGRYTVEATVVANGAIDVMTNTLEIQCFYNLEIDFTEVDWGTIIPGGSKVIPGDTTFGSSEFPTVKNTGNSGLQVGVRFSTMFQVGVPGPKEINLFDAAFGKSASVLQWIDPINAGDDAWFHNDNANQVLCANEVGKLDMSIHPPSTLPQGNYAGTVTILGAWAPEVCWNGLDGTLGPITPTPQIP